MFLKCLKRIFGVFGCISALISLDLAPLSLRKIALKCSQIRSKLHLPAFRNTLYDYRDDRIEVGFSVVRGWRGRGYATEALKKVLEYLTDNEGISCVTAWCVADNAASGRVLEKAGMRLVNTEKDGLPVGDRIYDKLIYEYGRETR